jgi:hypothetical protein
MVTSLTQLRKAAASRGWSGSPLCQFCPTLKPQVPPECHLTGSQLEVPSQYDSESEPRGTVTGPALSHGNWSNLKRPLHVMSAILSKASPRYFHAEEEILSSGRPLHLFGKEFVPSFFSIKECILHAIPDFPRQIADVIETTIELHLNTSARAKACILLHGLTRLEAETICWWSADVSTLSEMTTDQSPYYVYNTALRQRDAIRLNLWKHFSCYFINGLQKIPPTAAESFRGEKNRVTELSTQYTKGSQVRFRLRSSASLICN